MNLSSVIVEIRPKLQCGNVFLKFSEEIPPEDFNIELQTKSLKLILDDVNIIILQFDDHPDIDIDDRRLSALTFERENLSFRVSLLNVQHKLLLNPNEIPRKLTSSSYNKKCHLNMPLNVDCDLFCDSCSESLLLKSGNNWKISRILEFPSNLSDMHEWFCHPKKDIADEILFKSEDLLYGQQHFLVLNSSAISNYVMNEKQQIYCKFCQQHLGEFILSRKAIKLWNDRLKFSTSESGKLGIFENESASEIMYRIIMNIVEEMDLINADLYSKSLPEFQLPMQLIEILIEAIYPDTSEKFLMIKIIEKHVKILKYDRKSDGFTSPIIPMKETKSLKLLYRRETDQNNPLLHYWKNKITIRNINLSYKHFEEIFNLLEENSSLIPRSYRKTNDFILSYIFS